VHTGFLWENLRERDCSEDLGIDGIGLAQDRDRWWALVNAVMNLQVPLDAGNFWTGS
jgi:hypothetical protein